jgi:hypothetical protein
MVLNRRSITLIPAMALFCLLAAGPASGQIQRTSRSLQFGLYAGGLLSTPSSSFTQLPGAANCVGSVTATTFDGGSGGGFNVAGLLGITPLPSMEEGFLSHIGGSVAVGYATAKTTFQADEPIGSASDPAGNIRQITSRYTIETTISELRLEPAANFYIGPTLPLMFSLGLKLGFQMSGSYTQKEEIASPSGATFADGTRQRNNTAGDLEQTSKIGAGLSLGIGYDIPLSPTFSLRPQVSGVLGLSSPVQGVSWSPHEVRFGISALFTPEQTQSSPLQPVDDGGNKPKQ